MCTNYKAPNEDPGINELKIDNFIDLYRWTPWKPEIYKDYAAPIVRADGDGAVACIANFGFWPTDVQKDEQKKAKEHGREPPPLKTTVNATVERIATSRLYKPAWRAGQRCLIPVSWIYEPNWESGKHIRYRIGLADWKPFCVAGIWQAWLRQDGTTVCGMAMITINADGHPIMQRMHRPGDEKRSVVILRPADYDEWLHTMNVEAARAMLQIYPADEMAAEPK
ncbi:SOS response-associated peptidase [Burkholderia pyrrocinia]|uniref:SOS response-associated peptidase n=1 Tax=Burkholderia pyrrocinia TaxID=60550 RepID=UPI0010521540|nr:SOS response-associated peptidase family protein [Burkholderia pyrrocinia]TDA48258.1 DUF159 family protein [Burkholderia pyrrocinia]